MKEKSAHERLHNIRELVYSFELGKAQEKRIIDIIEDAVGFRAENKLSEGCCKICSKPLKVPGRDSFCDDCIPF